MRYFRVRIGSGDPRLVARDGRTAYDLSSARPALSSFRDLAMVASTTNRGVDDVAEALLDDAPVVGEDEVESGTVRPVVPDEVWAAGVTYEASGDAREDESGRPEMYQQVFENDRPELFFKATPSRTVGPDDRIGVREDSEWDVPEPELGIVLYEGDIVGYTVGNDVSSRDLEGQNPLYLPQAKVFERCCAVGPCVVSPETVEDPHDLEMSMTIERDGETEFEGETDTSLMARTCEELVSYRNRHDETPELSVLLTGTSIVPPSEFTLREDDRVEITIENVGTLTNTVTTV
ncbi:fumarylacetoacetate (FAA) hydrolase [Halogeometricum pallidum JCM 14848]|uniref:Fumarylacetoacetate (FAA) hydrolase n=1 Tax=Halogeometricum pallidum JCM 14848 TaxID=1227487 RepID=M0DEF5_HALPD|nr:fumarylacetoacetate hydrolase family protein [Halogeometricum pallidum]ELZ33881.1 fumarylacetoacetate (FAA) hydrolase [Halogeometricum pallidum JCM 14848]